MRREKGWTNLMVRIRRWVILLEGREVPRVEESPGVCCSGRATKSAIVLENEQSEEGASAVRRVPIGSLDRGALGPGSCRFAATISLYEWPGADCGGGWRLGRC